MTNIQIIDALIAILEWLKRRLESDQSTIFNAALDNIGKDASPSDIAPDELGCAESVSTILKSVVSDFPVITGTWTLMDTLERDNRFEPVSDPQPGDIVMSATGTSSKGNKAPFVGHTGIVGNENTIMSNDSYTGKWMSNYTIDTWRARWGVNGGYPVQFYRLV